MLINSETVTVNPALGESSGTTLTLINSMLAGIGMADDAVARTDKFAIIQAAPQSIVKLHAIQNVSLFLISLLSKVKALPSFQGSRYFGLPGLTRQTKGLANDP